LGVVVTEAGAAELGVVITEATAAETGLDIDGDVVTEAGAAELGVVITEAGAAEVGLHLGIVVTEAGAAEGGPDLGVIITEAASAEAGLDLGVVVTEAGAAELGVVITEATAAETGLDIDGDVVTEAGAAELGVVITEAGAAEVGLGGNLGLDIGAGGGFESGGSRDVVTIGVGFTVPDVEGLAEFLHLTGGTVIPGWKGSHPTLGFTPDVAGVSVLGGTMVGGISSHLCDHITVVGVLVLQGQLTGVKAGVLDDVVLVNRSCEEVVGCNPRGGEQLGVFPGEGTGNSQESATEYSFHFSE